MESFSEKLAHLGECRAKLEALEANGIDLRSKAAAPIWPNFIHAFDHVARDLGYQILKLIKPETRRVKS